ncbi:MAG: HD domain-containing protein [Propionibacteriales bacterium]|nr:HD domain-containing protein [Propionibacteriales bacterium]
MTIPGLVAWSEATAERLLSPLGRRWEHVRQVAALADLVGAAFAADHGTLVAAAYLHDVGYAPSLALEGFHPLDGARFVRDQGHERLARLVAHHSGARFEAKLRGYGDYLDEFPFEDSDLDRALTYCDLTTGPRGTRLTLEQRVKEIMDRYGSGHVTPRAILQGVPDFERAVSETERLVEHAGVVINGSQALSR